MRYADAKQNVYEPWRITHSGQVWLPRGAWSLLPDHVEYDDRRVCPDYPEHKFVLELDGISETGAKFEKQYAAMQSMLKAEQGLVFRPPGCVSGDTVIEINRAGRSFKITIRDLVHRFNGGAIQWGRTERAK